MSVVPQVSSASSAPPAVQPAERVFFPQLDIRTALQNAQNLGNNAVSALDQQRAADVRRVLDEIKANAGASDSPVNQIVSP